MKVYENLFGEPFEDGLRAIGAIVDLDRGPKGGEISVQCDALPLRRGAVLVINEWKPPRKRRYRKVTKVGHRDPVWSHGPARCRRCGWKSGDKVDRHGNLADVPAWNGKGGLFECPVCSSTQVEGIRRRVHLEPKPARQKTMAEEIYSRKPRGRWGLCPAS